MNQAILFTDIQSWHTVTQSVKFTAQQSGALIDCYITKKKLEKLSGLSMKTEQAIMDVFVEYRFEVEEIAEQLIEDEAFNEEGCVVIK
ncbi:DUF1488 family protein [Vibrio sagamiensis]|uniref:Transcriptional regulator n=1 Tax=Vibrio sagamiensis NBRC 104589 TaxID=1219064 RepID=A0A511QG46_9VIBR|nr:DUF1488 domain-containing protein [Vibrio sagamiensis]PNQ71175.1 DUF1488 domain-containing protein [Vibrio agarivorans]GEM76251.1 transcriptional regulator [Vibrio sagamiensis NBRC 104589]